MLLELSFAYRLSVKVVAVVVLMVAFYSGIRNPNKFVFTCVASQDARDGLFGHLFTYGSLVIIKKKQYITQNEVAHIDQ